MSILYKWPSFKIENKQFQKQNESWVPLPKGVPKNFLIKIKRSNRRHLHTISAGGEGFTLWNKNLSPPAKCSGHQPLWCEIIWKGPQRLFWFLSGTFLGQEQTHIRLIQIKYKVERAGEMPILEDIWTTPANLQIRGYCSLLQSCLLWCWIIPKKIYRDPN